MPAEKWNGEIDPTDVLMREYSDLDHDQHVAITYESTQTDGGRVEKVGTVHDTGRKLNPEHDERWDQEKERYVWESSYESCVVVTLEDENRRLFVFGDTGKVFSRQRWSDRKKMHVGDLTWFDADVIVA